MAIETILSAFEVDQTGVPPIGPIMLRNFEVTPARLLEPGPDGFSVDLGNNRSGNGNGAFYGNTPGNEYLNFMDRSEMKINLRSIEGDQLVFVFTPEDSIDQEEFMHFEIDSNFGVEVNGNRGIKIPDQDGYLFVFNDLPQGDDIPEKPWLVIEFVDNSSNNFGWSFRSITAEFRATGP